MVALGNDAGILSVGFQATNEPLSDTKEVDVVGLLHYIAVLGLFIAACSVFAVRDWHQFAKIGSAFLLVLAIAVVPELSVKLAEQTTSDRDVLWDATWPDEWRGTQVIVFEIDGEEHVIGGLESQDSVYELTLLACEFLQISQKLNNSIWGLILFHSMELLAMGGSLPSMEVEFQLEW